MRTVVATKRTGVTYVDDRVQFGSRHTLEAEIEAFSSDARGALGPTAINDSKTILSTAFNTIGVALQHHRGDGGAKPPSVSETVIRILRWNPT